MPRVVEGPEWSARGGWVVIAEYMGSLRVVFDPEGHDGAARDRCEAWVAEARALICA